MEAQFQPPLSGGCRLRLAGLFLFLTLGFVAYRSGSFMVWDDSAILAALAHESREAYDARIADHHRAFAAAPVGTVLALARNVFTQTDRGYRPLSHLYRDLFHHFLPAAELDRPGLLLRFLLGAVFGAFAVCTFLVARRFVRFELTAWLVVGLVLGSPPLAATAWVLRTFPQVVVPLVFCLDLLCYWWWVERGRPWPVAGLCLLLLVGPWLREVLFVAPLLIGFLEWRRAKRPTGMAVVALLGLLHALFPTALLKFTLLPEVPIKFVSQFGGSVTDQLAEPGVIRWHAGYHFLPLLPPLLYAVACLGPALGGLAALVRVPPGTGWFDRAVSFARSIAPGLVLLLTLAGWSSEAVGVCVCLFLPAIAVQHGHDLLAVWFLLLFVPLLRVFTEHIHFLYALSPAAIILAGSLERTWQWLSLRRGLAAGLRHAVVAVGLLGFADQSLNLYGAYCTMHANYGGIKRVGRWMREHLRPDDVAVCNALHGKEVWFRSGFHFRLYWSVPWGVLDPARVAADPRVFRKLVTDRGRHDVYLLSTDFDYPPNKAAHRHAYVYLFEVKKQDLGVVEGSWVRFPFLDPLRHLIPREYVPYLGAPDLVNDFYRGRARDGWWFRYEVGADYHLYRVTGNSVRPRLEGPISLVREGVGGFNILKIGEGYHAFPQSAGGFDLERYRRGDYGPRIEGLSPEEVQEEIEHRTRPADGETPPR